MIFCTKDFLPTNRRSIGILRASIFFQAISPAAYLIFTSVLVLASSVAAAGTIFTYTTEPTIRVCLAENRKHVSIQANVSCTLVYQGVIIAQLSDASISFRYSPEGTPVAYLRHQKIGFYSPMKFEPADSTELAVTPGDPTGITFDGETYPGTMEVMPESNGSFRVINAVPLETYLKGVVPNELINNLKPDELQACMAQAIAARNYAFFRMSNIDTFANDPASKGFDVYSDTRDQVYSGMGSYTAIADSAIDLTRGMIVEYDGQPARCYFHSTCGGHTAAVQNVWPGQPPLPYLQGVSDTDSATGEPFCIYNPHFYWSTSFSGSELTRLVKKNLAMASPNYSGVIVTGDVNSLRIISHFPSGRIDSLQIKMDNGRVYYVRGDRTRYLFKKHGVILKSSMFNILTLRRYGGSIAKIILEGRGNGHGVGMCQWGALGMSRLGYTYQQILEHYYPGTVIRKVY